MIISASRRTDIPAFYAPWFYNRIKAGEVLVRNPMNRRLVSRVNLSPEAVDCIVFSTKNPGPMLDRLDEIRDYNYYYLFTINPYDRTLEPGVPAKSGLIDTFRRLSDKIGPERVIWRYDPIILTDDIDADYHMKFFDTLASRLEGYTRRCMTGFLCMYQKTVRNMAVTTARAASEPEMLKIAAGLAQLSRSRGIELQSCSEKLDFEPLGIRKGRCFDPQLIESICGYPLSTRKDKYQREICRCAESIDLGEYDSCPHDCLYCYANSNKTNVRKKWTTHDPESPLLLGNLEQGDTVKDRVVKSFRMDSLFRP